MTIPIKMGGTGAGDAATALDVLGVTGLLADQSVGSVSKLFGRLGKNPVRVLGFYSAFGLGGGVFDWDATRPRTKHNGGTIVSPTVPFSGLQADLAAYLSGAGETAPAALGCWVRQHQADVFVSWFGAVGDGARPGISAPDLLPTGTDDSAAFRACRDYLQSVAFQPNLFVGFWGGFRFCLDANRAYIVKGDNPLGSSRPTAAQSSNYQLARQNWEVNGNGSLILWVLNSASDRFIAAGETLTRQHYGNYKLYVCNCVGKMGTFYDNTANASRNATAMPTFDRVEVYHSQPASNVNGLKYLFRFRGTNLGDRLSTRRCSFNQFHTGLYSKNAEAVQQDFQDTSFSSYIDDATFVLLRRHGSTFVLGESSLCLLKGERATLLKTRYGQDSLPADPFTTQAGSALVSVVHPDHNYTAEQPVTFSGAATVGGLTLNGVFTITAILGEDSYTITASAQATSDATGGGATVIEALKNGTSQIATNIRLEGRIECSTGKLVTLVDAEFGDITISGYEMSKGGLPNPASDTIIVRDSARVRAEDCQLYGNFIVAQPLVTNFRLVRSWALMLDRCQFVADPALSIFAMDAAGTRYSLRDAITGAVSVLPVIIRDTSVRNIGYDGLPVDASIYVHDFVYLANERVNVHPIPRYRAIVGRYRDSSQLYYLDDVEQFILPAGCTITSVKFTHANFGTTYDEVRLKIGSYLLVITAGLATTQRQVDVFVSPIVISETAKAERAVQCQILKSGTVQTNTSAQGFFEIEYRPALGRNELTTTEASGVRLTRAL